ncbi:SAM-dependent methyltransferase [Rhizobium leguminosarum]|uniref:Eco57I restriction-modification methylase domain-containing protein n=1 Tax=Rhizobium ruizarguesonis TaxID=2081791 RepID=UPI0013E0E395|nr:DNA methyltransferase [Rhizobium ruizarguesonis]NEJ90895.1 SAM-dependent methyltransferase [Rhizobium ruizarguesonis]
MEKETRCAIERATQRARSILEADFAEQLAGDFDVMVDGQVGERPGAHLGGHQKALRARIVASVQHKRMTGMAPKEAVADYLRDAAFTTLNRFVALKMLEARGLVQECITKGEASSGFVNEYLAFAPGAKFADGSGYRLYIESIFDELSTEIKVLFDRRDPAAAMWPRKATFGDLLNLLNTPELGSVWAEDETIGWVYQYFNSDEERDKMGRGKRPPATSRELAVRNQFFTPGYVVQFLSDNTLGRIWYEMRQGNTKLVELCRYMICRDGEVFADLGAPQVEDENVVRHRPLKDPRDLRIIDPACGSGHFLLYCFILLMIIYQEAWGVEVRSEITGKSLSEDYADEGEFRKAIPSLILQYNLYGVDIDPRCAQIAQLALWMRAQRAFKDLEIHRADRPTIRRSNIVVAEPMPGDPTLVDEFASSLHPPLLGHLFKEIVGAMTLAGEMGSLLPIEKQVASSIHIARGAYVQHQLNTAQALLPGFAPDGGDAKLDLSGINDDEFFEDVEDRIFAALKVFSADAVNGVGARRRLFAEDAEQGIALIDISRKRFDVVLMNPPFGAGSLLAKSVFEKAYPVTKNDVLTAFVERGIQLLQPRSRLGAITSRTPFFLSSCQRWREDILIKKAPPVAFADLGLGVLDGAMVEVAAYTLEKIETGQDEH